MTVRAQELEIRDSVVQAVAIDVVQRERQRLAAPL
jgi:hypothetical protein